MNRRLLTQRLLLAVIVLGLSATIAVFVVYRRMSNNPEALVELIKNEADMQMNKIQQTAMKNGIQEWRLEAESATLLEKKKTMLLINPEVEFFMKNGDNVFLTADRGTIYTDSSRLHVSGKVSANTDLYRFQTEMLEYDPSTKELFSDTPVTLSGESFSLQAGRMAMNLTSNITRFDGGVEGIISEDFQL